MNKDEAQQIFKKYEDHIDETGKDSFPFPNSYKKRPEQSIKDIETQDTQDLVDFWKNLMFVNHICHQPSSYDLMWIELIELELSERNPSILDELIDWTFEAEDEPNKENVL